MVRRGPQPAGWVNARDETLSRTDASTPRAPAAMRSTTEPTQLSRWR